MTRRPWWITAIGIVLTAIMLFPIYWMINVSLTPQSDMRKSPPDLFPFAPTFEGYERVLSDQLPYLGTSFVIGLGTVVLTLLLSAPAAYSLAKLRPRGRSLASEYAAGADSSSVSTTVPRPITKLVPRYGSWSERTLS